MRELEEELGVRVEPDQMEFICSTKAEVVLNDGKYINNEVIDVYLIGSLYNGSKGNTDSIQRWK